MTVYLCINRTFLVIWLSITVAVVAFIWSQQPNLDQLPKDFGLNIQEIIASRGFESETHFIETPDGYILQTVRILNPHVSDRSKLKPILLHHGFQCSGSVWLVASDGKLGSDGKYLEDDRVDENNAIGNSLGFVLATQGYDVWLANYRGNIYSTNHTTLSVNDDKFWNFTIDDMIRVDLPTQIEYIRTKTKRSTISYIGHSQGNMMMFGLLAARPEYSRVIKPHIALSPVSYFTHFEASLKYFIPFKRLILKYKPTDSFTNLHKKTGLSRLCANPVLQHNVCYALYWFLFGSPKAQLDFDRLPVYMDNILLGSSTRNFVQILQQIAQPNYYDYNDEADDTKNQGNLQKYQRPYPPAYKYQNINSTDIALIYTKRDWYNHLADVQLLKDNLNVKLLDDYAVPDESWNHMDLVWGREVGKYVNARILKILEKY